MASLAARAERYALAACQLGHRAAALAGPKPKDWEDDADQLSALYDREYRLVEAKRALQRKGVFPAWRDAGNVSAYRALYQRVALELEAVKAALVIHRNRQAMLADVVFGSEKISEDPAFIARYLAMPEDDDPP